jgi:DNA segregation ATPase FtsK/SpoIIIE, S-DNA-T family
MKLFSFFEKIRRISGGLNPTPIFNSNSEEIIENENQRVQPIIQEYDEFKTDAMQNVSQERADEADERCLEENVIANRNSFDPEETLRNYRFPTLDLLEPFNSEILQTNREDLERTKEQLIRTLKSLGIEVKAISVTKGPSISLFEVSLSKAVRATRLQSLHEDIMLNLAARSIRIFSTSPGLIGFEIPNKDRGFISLSELLSDESFIDSKLTLPIALGKGYNQIYIADLSAMHHLVVADMAGNELSACINLILMSLLYKNHPSKLKLILFDFKGIELMPYAQIERHFLAKTPFQSAAIVTDFRNAIYNLKSLIDEMNDRLGLLKDAGSRNVEEYNQRFINRRLNPENGHRFLPFIILVINEFSNLIAIDRERVEDLMDTLGKSAHTVGIYMIIATQRPSRHVITSAIKKTFLSRIAFKLQSKADSRIIIDAEGAEQLLGDNDMLLYYNSEFIRLQSANPSTTEIDRVVELISGQLGYSFAHPLPEPEMDDDDNPKNIDLKNRDKLFGDCARLVVQMQSGSTSNLQRRLNLGYHQAGRIMDQLEAAGIVGPAAGSKPREVYFKTESELEQFLQSLE